MLVNYLVGIGKNNVGKFAFYFPARTRLSDSSVYQLVLT